jgi:hypothetical protein
MFNDSALYRWFSIITLSIAVILGAIAAYSMLYVEPAIDALLDKGSETAYTESGEPTDETIHCCVKILCPRLRDAAQPADFRALRKL